MKGEWRWKIRKEEMKAEMKGEEDEGMKGGRIGRIGRIQRMWGCNGKGGDKLRMGR
jgi:hypothetical protein